jgi:hypothetical protein
MTAFFDPPSVPALGNSGYSGKEEPTAQIRVVGS